MSLFNVFGSPASPQQAKEYKSSASFPVVTYQTTGRVGWSARDPVSMVKSGFCANPVGFRAVRLIAEAAAALPMVLQDKERRYESHPVLSLLDAPNPAQTRADLLEALFGQILLSGNGYLEAGLSTSGMPIELHVLRSDRMSLVPGSDGWPAAYDYTVAGRKRRFEVSGSTCQICHIRSFHPMTIIMDFRPCKLRRRRLMCIIRPPLVQSIARQCGATFGCNRIPWS